MFKKNILTFILCFLFNSCADSILDSSSDNIIENNSSIIGTWTSSDWCIYEDYTCTGNCVGGAFADLWILAENQIAPPFIVTFSEDSTAQWQALNDDETPEDFVFSENLDGSFSLIDNGDEDLRVELANSKMLIYWYEDGRCIEFTLIK